MIEVFRVMRVEQEKGKTVAIVEKERTTACGSCPSSSICGVPKKLELHIECPNGMSIQAMDELEVEIPQTPVTRLAFLTYGIPTILFIISLFLTSEIFQLSDIQSLLWSLLPLSLGFLALRGIDRTMRGKFRPKILKKVGS